MKVTFDVECTPEEARRFFGLPDLTPVHDAYIERMTTMVGEGITPAAMTEMMRSWGPMGEVGTQMFKTLFAQMGMDQMTGAARPR